MGSGHVPVGGSGGDVGRGGHIGGSGGRAHFTNQEPGEQIRLDLDDNIEDSIKGALRKGEDAILVKEDMELEKVIQTES
jgi:hypothetical protein